MKKIISVLFTFFLLFIGWGLFTQTASTTEADWWVRPAEREAQPTRAPRVSLAPRTQAELISPPVNNSPTPEPPGSLSSSQNPCAPGQSFTGPNCGWSPGISEYNHDSSSGDGNSQIVGYRIGGPEVLGLSDTGSIGSQISIPDIMLLLGVLCLLIYVKAKFSAKKAGLK